MPKKMAVVKYSKCHPELCDSGVCVAALVCLRKLIEQEAPYEAPTPSPCACQNCAKCVLACPLKAIELV